MPDLVSNLADIIVPATVALAISLGASLIVAFRAGPAQEAYVRALQGRLAVVEQERDDATIEIPKLEARIVALEARVHELQEGVTERDREIARLYRRLDADERRMPTP
jgi:cell division protein FtsB